MVDINEGVIKFNTKEHFQTNALEPNEYRTLESWREKLWDIKLIGSYCPSNIGYGNLSVKVDYSDILQTSEPQFLITGTQTGHKKNLDGNDYVRVLNFDQENFSVTSSGPCSPSSETPSHFSLYKAKSDINAIFHVHDNIIWKYLSENHDLATPADVEYGTPEMAKQFLNLDLPDKGIIVMKGHEDGFLSYAKNMEEAGELLLEIYNKLNR
ncbi:class II aldolase/adducin family protein [Bacteriovoracaceae bacterium]|nr:class II aldolase/adducin family protein [Bacteriovoracaceae bacterium]